MYECLVQTTRSVLQTMQVISFDYEKGTRTVKHTLSLYNPVVTLEMILLYTPVKVVFCFASGALITQYLQNCYLLFPNFFLQQG